MSRFLRVFLCAILVVAVISSLSTLAVSADNTTTLSIPMSYGQTEARDMLALVNSFRTDTSGGAWYWNSDDTTKTVYNTEGNPTLQPLKYDYELEKAAMIRAAEIAVSFSHTRPDGSSCFTVFPSTGYDTRGENIAAGQRTASSAFTAWQENNDPYKDQGHRRNMLNPNFNAIGIGHVYVNGIHYWVQLLGYTDNSTTETTANNNEFSASIDVLNSKLTFVDAYCDPAAREIEVGTSANAPKFIVAYTFTDHWPSSGNILTSPDTTWTSTDETVASVSAGKLKGNNIGTATLTATSGSYSDTVSVTVTPISISAATVTLEYTSVEYTGNKFEPAVVSVIIPGSQPGVDDKTLVEGTDYTITYSDNKAVGTATVNIKGIGNYKGTAAAPFTINECAHVYDSGTQTKAPSCGAAGIMTYECTKCDHVKNDPIAALEHTPGTEANCGNAQICTVCNATIVPASGNHTDENDDGFCDVCSVDLNAPTTTTTTTTTTSATTKKTNKNNKDEEKNDKYPSTGESNSGSIIALVIFCSSAMIIFFIVLNENLKTKINRRLRL